MHPPYRIHVSPHISSTASPLYSLKMNLQWSGFARSAGEHALGLFQFVLGTGLGNATCGTANTHGGGDRPLAPLISASIKNPTLISLDGGGGPLIR